MSRRTGTFKEFKDYTLAVVRGERTIDPSEPKVWSELVASKGGAKPMQLTPLEPGSSHYLHSMLRERIVEQMFVGEALRLLWNLGARDIEVLRPEVDAGGYDLVMSCRRIVRHIQFKSIMEGGKAAGVSVSLKLVEKPSGCVIWIVVSSKELDIKSYRWFGDVPGKPLPDISEFKPAKHTGGNAERSKLERPNYRVVPRSRFENLPTLNALLQRLFGPLQ